MNESQSAPYDESVFLRAEATNAAGEVVDDIWHAIVEREKAVDAIVEASSFDKREVLDSTDYFAKAEIVRQLQEKYGIVPGATDLETDD